MEPIQLSQQAAAVMGAVLVFTQPAKRILERFVGELQPLAAAALAAIIGGLSTVALAAADGLVTEDEIVAGVTGMVGAMLAFRAWLSSSRRGAPVRVSARSFIPFIGAALLVSACVAPSNDPKACDRLSKWERGLGWARVGKNVIVDFATTGCAFAPANPYCAAVPTASALAEGIITVCEEQVRVLLRHGCDSPEGRAAELVLAAQLPGIRKAAREVGKEDALPPMPELPEPLERQPEGWN